MAGAADWTVAAGHTPLPELAALVAAAGRVVCGDTGVAHLATALGTPSVLLFGPTPPAWWGPLIERDRHRVLWHGLSVVPRRPGWRGPHPALAAITVDEVLATVQRLRIAAATGTRR